MIDLPELEEYLQLELKFDLIAGQHVWHSEADQDSGVWERWVDLQTRYPTRDLIRAVLHLHQLLTAIQSAWGNAQRLAAVLDQVTGADAAQLAGVLHQVEYDRQFFRNACPWCGGLDPNPAESQGQHKPHYGSGFGHRPDCPRQAALAAHERLVQLLNGNLGDSHQRVAAQTGNEGASHE